MNEGVVKLNGYKYNLRDNIMASYLSRLPGKVNTGSDAFDKEQFLSNWINSDHRGGIGVDEMDESIHADRSWWTNCITDYDSHLPLPRLATAISGTGSGWVRAATSANSVRDGSGAWSNTTNAHDGDTTTDATCAAFNGNDGWTDYITFTLYDLTADAIRFYTDQDNTKYDVIDIDLYYGGTWNHLYQGSFTAGTWETKTIGSTQTVTVGRVSFQHNGTASDAASLAEFEFRAATPQTDFSSAGSFHFANFNGHLYMAADDKLYRMDSNRLFYRLYHFTSLEITALIPSLNSMLYIYLGDSDNYWYMNTNELFTDTNVNDANLGVQWDNKLWKMDTDGNWWYSATPNSATPAWTSQNGITDIASQVERLEVGKDSDGNPVIYCATNTILKVFDFTNNLWLDTEVKLYGNQYHGKGFTYWNAAHYLSYGLGVKKYTVGSTGTLSESGLNRDGGLPAEYNGIITRLINGGDQMMALVDASLTTGTSQSGLYAYNGQSWSCWWADSNNDAAMHDAIVTARSGDYAVYWDCGGIVYYIDIPQGLSNPKYLTGTQTYATSGIYLSPWFDANNQAFQKLSKAIVSYAKGITATETVVIKYRLNKTYTDRDSGWTTLDTLNAAGDNGEVINQLASGAGYGFNSFQYRLDFARGSTTTLSPDLLSLAMSYRLVTQGNWSWVLSLVIDGSHNTSAAEKWANLESAIESNTDIPFIFKHIDDADAAVVTANTHYVQFVNPSELIAAGMDFTGSINIQVIETWLPA